MRLGFPGGRADPAGAKYAHLLGSIRRERDFGNIVRPNSEKRLANTRAAYPHVFDPRKVLDDGDFTLP